MTSLFHSCRKGVNKGDYMGATVLNKVSGWFLMKFQERNLVLSKTPHKSQMIAVGIHMRILQDNILKEDVYGVNTVFYGNKGPIFSWQ